jgi:iron-sulfur cluster repair protein YtfE (RIC family)
MNAGDFLAALSTVEQDHRVVLENLQALKEAVDHLLSPGDCDSTRALARLQEIRVHLSTLFESHMEEEETTLFPLLEQHKPEGAELVARLRLEHDQIRGKREELGNCIEVAAGLENGPPIMVLRDLFAYGWELWELLDNHAHAETHALHQCAPQFLEGAAISRPG